MTYTDIISRTSKTLTTSLAVFVACFFIGTMTPRPAHATCTAGIYECLEGLVDADIWWEALNWTTTQQDYFNQTLYQDYFVDKFYEEFMVQTLWEENMRPAL